jgi:hypothetical protein
LCSLSPLIWYWLLYDISTILIICLQPSAPLDTCGQFWAG